MTNERLSTIIFRKKELPFVFRIPPVPLLHPLIRCVGDFQNGSVFESIGEEVSGFPFMFRLFNQFCLQKSASL